MNKLLKELALIAGFCFISATAISFAGLVDATPNKLTRIVFNLN